MASVSAKRGRPDHPLWKHFEKVGDKNAKTKRYSAKWNFCDTKLLDGRNNLMRSHLLEDCRSVTEQVKEAIEDAEEQNHGDGGRVKSKAEHSQSKIDQHFRKKTTDIKVHEAWDAKVLRFFVTAGLAWRQASSVFFLDLICSLAPGYLPPSK